MTESICAREDCGVPFVKKTHNQIYHDDECCRIATNERIMERYYEKKRKRGGEKRYCKGKACDTVLSRYNDGDLCSMCERGPRVERFLR